MIPVILSGGSGTRLWPVSRTKLPKQFCTIFEQSLHTMTLNRLGKLGTPWVITSKSLRDLTVKNMRDLSMDPSNILLEPVAKNTAPAIALLTFHLMQKGLQDEVTGIFPADHIIENEDAFLAAVHLAKADALKGKVVTLGITPDHPATGYGYIQTSKTKGATQGDLASYSVLKFHEKPSIEKASAFLKEGGFFWNAGIFVFKVSTMATLLEQHQPELWKAVSSLKTDLSNIDAIYSKVDNISIDYAIMEKLSADNLSCVPCDMGWNDVGSWDAIADILGGVSTDNKVEVHSKNNFVQSTVDKTYAFVGVEDLIVVDTTDALLIAKKGATQAVKEAVDVLKLKKPTLLTDHTFEERPWGRFEILRDTECFKSKVIQVNPAQQISYQSHAKREEHWLITKGKGEVVLNDEIIPVSPGTYVKIPLGAKHRIRNSGNNTIEFVEVQMGTYFGEDDIVRYEDDYLRS